MTKTKGSRKLTDAPRSKAIVADAWDRVKAQHAVAPNWPFIGVVAIVDRMLAEEHIEDGRDIGDALVLCHDLGLPATAKTIRDCMARVSKGRGTGASAYR